MMNKFFNQISGIIQVNIKGKKPEKVLNMALSRGIYIWGVKKVNDNIEFKVRSNSIEALKNIGDESNHEIEIISKEGLPFLTQVLKRRLGFITGILIFILALYFMSAFVWFVEVSGNKYIKNEQIILTAAKYGVYQGAPKWSFSRTKVEESILKDIDSLAYVKVDIRGVKANIEVVEKVLPKSDITGPCHIVATKDGVIEEVLVLEGRANVKKEDVVVKGDILISGVIIPEVNPYFVVPELEDEEVAEEEPTLVRARGIVKAKVWYEGYGECQLISEKINITDNKVTEIFLITPWQKYKLKGDNKRNFALAEEKVTIKEVNTPIGNVGLIKIVRQEKVKNIKKYSEKEATNIAKDKAISNLNNKLKGDIKVNTIDMEVLSAPSDLILRVKVSMEVIEDIAEPEPISMEWSGKDKYN